jgi:hypothetical protein
MFRAVRRGRALSSIVRTGRTLRASGPAPRPRDYRRTPPRRTPSRTTTTPDALTVAMTGRAYAPQIRCIRSRPATNAAAITSPLARPAVRMKAATSASASAWRSAGRAPNVLVLAQEHPTSGPDETKDVRVGRVGRKVRPMDLHLRPGQAERLGHGVSAEAPVYEEDDLFTRHAPCAAPT